MRRMIATLRAKMLRTRLACRTLAAFVAERALSLAAHCIAAVFAALTQTVVGREIGVERCAFACMLAFSAALRIPVAVGFTPWTRVAVDMLGRGCADAFVAAEARYGRGRILFVASHNDRHKIYAAKVIKFPYVGHCRTE